MNEPILMVMRSVCEECDAFLGYSHAEDCRLNGMVQLDQSTDKMTLLADSDAHPYSDVELEKLAKEQEVD